MQTKKIIITKKDFNNLENLFQNHLKQNPEDTSSLKTIQSIIDQCID